MIKALAVFTFFLTGSMIAVGQTSAVTSNGDEVILYNDGTWKFTNNQDSLRDKADTNKTAFFKNNNATFLLKSNITNFGIYLNPKKWSFSKSGANEAAEYSLQLKGQEAYAMVIIEKIEIPLKNLRDIAVANAKKAAQDIKVMKEEYRVVNGVTVLCLQMDGTTQGMKFSYLGYYYSFEKGSVQFVTYTSQNMLKEYQTDMEEILNGFVVL